MFLASVLIAFLVATPLEIALGLTIALAGLTIALFVGYGRAEITIDGDRLRAGTAAIEVQYLETPEVLDEEQTRRALGVEADARAYLLVRPYLDESVRVPLADPSDPTPYWLIMTRDARRLAGAIDAAITNSRA
jgi:hypothetical protein